MEEDVKKYQDAAEQGDAEAQFNTGTMYYNGEGVKQDYAEAIKWFKKSAENGFVKAQNYLGSMYYNGEGVKQNYFKAVEWYQKAAEQGDAFAQNRLGLMYANGRGVEQDYFKAVEWYQKAAEQGNASAQLNLGVMYNIGKGVKQDYFKAVEWYKKAAEQGFAPAQYNLGVMYKNGRGVEQGYVEAVKWYKKSADKGHAGAQLNLGFMYEKGQGVEQDYAEAVKWYKKAAEQGGAEAQCNLGYMYESGRGVEQDYAEAVKWYKKATEQGFARAQCNLGYMYESGRGVEQDYVEAVKWYKKAAEQGYANAQGNLGYMYKNGQGVEQDYAEAVKWYKKSAEQGDARAQHNLGNMYANGQGVEQDYAEAVKWYKKAAEQGDAQAQEKLEILYKKGYGLDQDIRWYTEKEDLGVASRKKIVLDTETTGLSPSKNTIVQLSIIDGNNTTLFNEYFKPSKEHYSGALFDSWMQASKITGITPEKVENSHSIDFYREKIQSILDNAEEILIYNAKFDVGFMKSHGFTFKPTTTITDVMLEYSNYKKVINPKYGDYKWFKLVEAASEFNYDFGAHDSLEDVKATLFVHNEIEKSKSSLEYESDQFNFTEFSQLLKERETLKSSLEYESAQFNLTNFKKLTLLLKERETLSREILINKYEILRNEINQVVTKYHSNYMGAILSNYNFNPVIEEDDFSLLTDEYISYQVIQLEKVKQKLKLDRYRKRKTILELLEEFEKNQLNSSFDPKLFHPARTQEEWLKEKEEIYQVKKYEWANEKRLLKEKGLSRLDLIKFLKEYAVKNPYGEFYDWCSSYKKEEKIFDRYSEAFYDILDKEELADKFEMFTITSDIYDLLAFSQECIRTCESLDKLEGFFAKVSTVIGMHELATEIKQDINDHHNIRQYSSLLKPKVNEFIDVIEKSNDKSKDNTKDNLVGCLILLIVGLIVVIKLFA